MSGKFCGQRIGVGYVDKGVPAHVGMTFGVGQRRHIPVRFDQDLRAFAADYGEKGIRIARDGEEDVIESLLPGDKIIVGGLQRVRPGMTVEVKPFEELND